MDIDKITNFFKEISPIAGVLGTALSVVKTWLVVDNLANKPRLRKELKADLDILKFITENKLMNENDPEHKLLTEHIKKQVVALTGEDKKKEEDKRKEEDEKKEIVTKNSRQFWVGLVKRSPQFLIGLSMAGGSGYWTYYIIKSPNTSNWWLILSIYVALAGLGFLITPWKNVASNRALKQ